MRPRFGLQLPAAGAMLLLSSCLTPHLALSPPVAAGPDAVRTVTGAQYERGQLHLRLWGFHLPFRCSYGGCVSNWTKNYGKGLSGRRPWTSTSAGNWKE